MYILKHRNGWIMGAQWNKGADPALARTYGSVGMVANIGVDAQVVRNDFDGAPFFREMIDAEDTLGNKFVRIPKIYIKKVDEESNKEWLISNRQYDGFYLPQNYWDFTNNRDLPFFDFGKYQASKAATKLQSVAGAYPLMNDTIVNFRTFAQNNNVGGLLGYQQLDIHAIDLLETLFYVEFATLNSQSIMLGYTNGQYSASHVATVAENAVNRIIIANAYAALFKVGQAISIGTSIGGNQICYNRTITAVDAYDAGNKAISFDGAAVNIALGNIVYNSGRKSGACDAVVASSGALTANDGYYPCKYRGIENPFGNMWQWVDGVNITDRRAWICKNPANYASNVFASPYEQLSYVNAASDGYPTAMGYDTNYPFAQLPSVIGGDLSHYYSDYYYQTTGQRVARFGGSWFIGSNAGLSCWALTADSSSASLNIGGRLCRKGLQ